jgi:hypothetical protein
MYPARRVASINGPWSCAMHFPYLPIIGTTSRFGWTGSNLYYIFLITKTKTSYESVARNHNDKINKHGYILTFSRKSSVKISSAKYFAARQVFQLLMAAPMAGMISSPAKNRARSFIFSLSRLSRSGYTSFMKISHLPKLGNLPN